MPEQELPVTGLTALSQVVFDLAQSKGFHSGPSPKEDVGAMAKHVANLHGEVSELWECVRKGTLFTPCSKVPEITNAEEELADIIIRALHTAASLGVDIDKAVRLKHGYNQTRPYRHGGKLA